MTIDGSHHTLLLETVSDVLGVAEVGPDDELFALGAGSLDLITIQTTLEQAAGLTIPIDALFSGLNIGELVDEMEPVDVHDPVPVASRPPQGTPVPLSFAQEEIWEYIAVPESERVRQFDLSAAFTVHGELDPDTLSRALDAVLLRQRVLSMAISRDVAEQRESEADRVTLTVTESNSADAGSASHPPAVSVDPASGELLYANLERRPSEDDVLTVHTHHLACDGWSMDVMLKDLHDAYEALRRGEEIDFAPLPMTYAHYVLWERTYFDPEKVEATARYWAHSLAGLGVPLNGRPDTVASRPGVPAEVMAVQVPDELVSRYAESLRTAGISLFAGLLTDVGRILTSMEGRDVLVGTNVANRFMSDLHPLVGHMSNSAFFRVPASGDLSSARNHVRDNFIESLPYQRLNWLKWVRALGWDDPFKYRVALQNRTSRYIDAPVAFGDAMLTPFSPPRTRPPRIRRAIGLNLFRTRAGLEGSFAFDPARVSRPDAERFLATFTSTFERD